jgi:hypothetical protein
MKLNELEQEKLYRITERLAISCGSSQPSKSELLDARRTVADEMKAIQDDLDRDEVVKDWVP